MNSSAVMKTWPEFVIETEEAHRAQSRAGEPTGWESVVFELGEVSDEIEEVTPTNG